MAKIELFTSPSCPHCPPAKESLSKTVEMLKSDGLDVSLEILGVDSPLGAMKARSYGISSVPSAVVAGEKSAFLLDSISFNTVKRACIVADGKAEMPERRGFFERLFGR